MNEQECATAYQELASMLKELGMGWLVEKVELTIQRGENVAVSKNSQPYYRLENEPLKHREKLFLLIDAIERALVETTAMEVEISDFLISEKLEPKIITSDGNYATIDDYRPEVVYAKKQKADALKALLEELRRDALAHVD
ncbi:MULTISPECIES: hypothetical protein [Aerosakkonema]|uniref:hypothetical protein n=1 Tax=Aerosakkonema TaxID=1246629 RepID=UPI0035B9F599